MSPTPLHLAERVHQLQGRGAQDGDEQRREKKTSEREKQFDCGLLRCLLGALPALGA